MATIYKNKCAVHDYQNLMCDTQNDCSEPKAKWYFPQQNPNIGNCLRIDPHYSTVDDETRNSVYNILITCTYRRP